MLMDVFLIKPKHIVDTMFGIYFGGIYYHKIEFSKQATEYLLLD